MSNVTEQLVQSALDHQRTARRWRAIAVAALLALGAIGLFRVFSGDRVPIPVSEYTSGRAGWVFPAGPATTWAWKRASCARARLICCGTHCYEAG